MNHALFNKVSFLFFTTNQCTEFIEATRRNVEVHSVLRHKCSNLIFPSDRVILPPLYFDTISQGLITQYDGEAKLYRGRRKIFLQSDECTMHYYLITQSSQLHNLNQLFSSVRLNAQ
jgi:hypothetical protein